MPRAEPHLDWLPDAQAALNTDAAFRKLGSADFKLGLSIGGAARIVTFEAFLIASVAEASAAELRDADLVIEMSPADWNRYLRQRAGGQGESLLSLDLSRHLVRARDPLQRLLFERYNRSIQALVDRGAAITEARRLATAR